MPNLTDVPSRPGLCVWREARDAMATAPARVLCLGDSITEGMDAQVTTRWTATLAALIANRYGVATSTTGHLVTYFASPSNPTSPIVKTNAVDASDFGTSCNGTAKIMGTTGKLSLTAIGTSVKVYYATGSTVGFTVWIDGAQVGGVHGGPSVPIVDGNIATVAMGASGSHLIEVCAGGGDSYITGLAVFDGNESSGLQMFNAGVYGARSAATSLPIKTVATWQEAYRAIAPHLVIMMFGANDYIDGLPLATYQAQLDTIIANIRNAVQAGQPQPSILLVAPPKINRPLATMQWETYVHAARTATAKDGTAAFFDLGTLMPDIGSATGNASGLYADTTHPTVAGHARIAAILDQVLADQPVA